MVDFLTTKGVSFQLERIIKNARERLILVSPYLQLSKTLLERIRDADKKGVEITLVCRQGALRPEDRDQLQSLKNLALYFHEGLHAKCYYNEDSMVITSMNIYQYSEQNREMGLLFRKEEDSKIFSEALEETKSIINSSVKDDLSKVKADAYKLHTAQKGYCIRCHTPIPLDLERPLCFACFVEWSEWENPLYEEEFCHICGKPALTTILKPLCNACYWK